MKTQQKKNRKVVVWNLNFVDYGVSAIIIFLVLWVIGKALWYHTLFFENWLTHIVLSLFLLISMLIILFLSRDVYYVEEKQ